MAREIPQAMLLSFSWDGVTARHCFFLQRPSASLAPQGPVAQAAQASGAPPEVVDREPVRFCDIAACQDLIFAVTPAPVVHLLIWHITGVAFHAIPLGEYLRQDENKKYILKKTYNEKHLKHKLLK